MRERERNHTASVLQRDAERRRKARTYEKGNAKKNAGLMLAALGSPVRRMLLWRLRSEGAMSLSKLGRPYKFKLPHLQKHVAVLESAGLITTKKTGRIRICIYNRAAAEELASWLLARGR